MLVKVRLDEISNKHVFYFSINYLGFSALIIGEFYSLMDRY